MLIDFEGCSPSIGKETFISKGAQLIGKVKMGQGCSVWPCAIIRADINTIEVGDFSNVQEHVSIHVESDTPTVIGNKVTIGHGAILHACTIEDCTLIGIGAVVLDKAKIGHHCLIAAGSLVAPGKEFPPYSMVMGSPGKVVRTLSEEEAKQLEHHAERYHELALLHKGGKNG